MTWLERHVDAPSRLLVAPPGFGKTTLVRHYLRERQFANTYVSLDGRDSPAAMLARIAVAFGLEAEAGANAAALVDALSHGPAGEVIFDDADPLDSGAADTLRWLVAHFPEQLRLIVCSRSRNVVAGARGLVSGAIAHLGAEPLAFTPSEIAQLCELQHVVASSNDVEALMRNSEGWPIVVAGIVRSCAFSERALSGACQAWQREQSETFRNFVLEEASRSNSGALLRRVLLDDDLMCSQAEWEELEREGLFARRRNARIDLYRPLIDLFSPGSSAAPERPFAETLPIVASVLGAFEASIGGRPVKWVRRKDAQLFKYLLLKPTGTASRQELLDLFWPNRERQAAIAALRTTCSNIRHALREVVGYARASVYFSTDFDVRVATELVVNDLQRFRANVAAARLAEDAGDQRRAQSHWSEVANLYAGDFIVDVPCAFYVEIAEEVTATFERARVCLKTA